LKLRVRGDGGRVGGRERPWAIKRPCTYDDYDTERAQSRYFDFGHEKVSFYTIN
jgi:hypothetical protein